MDNRIKELCLEKGLSQRKLSEKTGISQQALSLYEKGQRKPKIETWQKLADYFEVPISYLKGLSNYNRDIDTLEKFKKQYSYELDKDIDNITGLKKIFVSKNPYGVNDSEWVFVDKLEKLLKNKELSEYAINNVMGYMTDFFYLSIALTSNDLDNDNIGLDPKIISLARELVDEFESREYNN